MSPALVRQLIRYRTLLTALTNAAITWTVLIIAPLGLFAVITCTVLVFISSFITIWLGDHALTALLEAGDRNGIWTPQGTATLDPTHPNNPPDQVLRIRRDRQLPR